MKNVEGWVSERDRQEGKWMRLRDVTPQGLLATLEHTVVTAMLLGHSAE